ncbi:hypothetical protein E2562_014390 [Oryza meyeriana var. granulata]|uniref:Uncharacterized protein n=1 Tax=Oryza meyeriana var. granulata TaxID=110450 RepID=A0A6G1CPY4_9ORYZ|nr:hypothetical protein E2562_014390 [Oryza meyeriana var. granulata]
MAQLGLEDGDRILGNPPPPSSPVAPPILSHPAKLHLEDEGKATLLASPYSPQQLVAEGDNGKRSIALWLRLRDGGGGGRLGSSGNPYLPLLCLLPLSSLERRVHIRPSRAGKAPDLVRMDAGWKGWRRRLRS